jgi:hypothetical protein
MRYQVAGVVMLPRDPEVFLSPLYEAFNRRLRNDPMLLPAVLSFYGAKSAVILRMRAVDTIAGKFKKFANQPNRSAQRLHRLPKENQLLFDFFANGWSALESFCFGSYYLGVGIDSRKFDMEKKRQTIAPEVVLESFRDFAPTDKFTLGLEKCLKSPKFTVIDAMRNSLLHSVAPGRTLHFSTLQDIIDLDQWYKGDWRRAWGDLGIPRPVLKFSLESNALIKQRSWIEGQLERLSTALCDLASAHGLK